MIVLLGIVIGLLVAFLVVFGTVFIVLADERAVSVFEICPAMGGFVGESWGLLCVPAWDEMVDWLPAGAVFPIALL